MVSALALKPRLIPQTPTTVPVGKPSLYVVSSSPKVPPSGPVMPPTPRSSFGRLFGGIGFSISLLWSGAAAYTAVRAVPKQLPWMPGPAVAPEIWSDPERVTIEAHSRFGHMDMGHLNLLRFVREKQAMPPLRDPMHDPHDRNLFVQNEEGEWVQIPLEGQQSGALEIGTLWKHGLPGKPMHERAVDELRLIEIELGRRNFQVEEAKTDADKTWFEQYTKYIQELAEAMRKRANGENVPLPILVINTQEETKMPQQSKPQMMCSTGDVGSDTPKSATPHEPNNLTSAGEEAEPDDHSYIISGGKQGSDRLVVLANATWITSKPFLTDAGLKEGMSYLDVGCGNGEITVRVAELVGKNGLLHGIDMDPTKIALAQQKAKRAGIDNASFQTLDLEQESLEPDAKFDFIYLRFILSHLRDPQSLLAKLKSHLNPGGTIAIEDVYFDGHYCEPSCRAFNRYVELYKAAAVARGADANIGPKLETMVKDTGYRDIKVSTVTPVFAEGDGKQMALITMDAISKSVVALGLASQKEVQQILSELTEFTSDPNSRLSIPKLYQVSFRRE